MLLIKLVEPIQFCLRLLSLLRLRWLTLLDGQDVCIFDCDQLEKLVKQVHHPVYIVQLDGDVAYYFLCFFLRRNLDLIVFQIWKQRGEHLHFVLERSEQDWFVQVEDQDAIDPQAQLDLLVRADHRRDLELVFGTIELGCKLLHSVHVHDQELLFQ